MIHLSIKIWVRIQLLLDSYSDVKNYDRLRDASFNVPEDSHRKYSHLK